MQPELYSDGIGEITVTGPVVRVDLVSLSATERDANNNPKSVVRQRVIFTLESFANSVDLMQKALQGLVDMGAVKRTSATVGDGQVEREGAAPRSRLSPNFG